MKKETGDKDDRIQMKMRRNTKDYVTRLERQLGRIKHNG